MDANVSGNTVTVEIADMEVTLPVKFTAGQTLTEAQATVLDVAYQRQFRNNQNALAKSRAEAYAKATTEAERNAKAPLSAMDIAALYTDYEPNVGSTPRASAMDKIRAEASWRFWTSYVKAHNDSVTSGGPPVIRKAGNMVLTTAYRAKKLEDGTVLSAQDQKDSFISGLLSRDNYAPLIQPYIDAILAERGTKADKADTATSSADLLGDDGEEC